MPNRASLTRRIASLLLLVMVLAPVVAVADQRSDLLIRMLTTSPEFRVRTQAALSLGRTDGGSDVVAALVRALGDDNAAVRAAAATALGTVGDASSVAALRRAQQDSDSGVRRAAAGSLRTVEARAGSGAGSATAASTSSSSSGSDSSASAGSARYYVGVGMPGSRAPRISGDLLQHARNVVVAQVRSVGGAEIAPDNESTTAARSVLQRRRLAGVYLDCSIVSAEATASGTRVAVSVIVGTYPGRDMRAILNGAATVPGASGPEADRMAIEGAIRGAMRNLPQAMASAGR